MISAIIFAGEAYEGHLRFLNKEPLMKHVVRVSSHISNLGFSESDQIKALLHEVLRVDGSTVRDIEKEFGWDIAESVLHLTDPTIFHGNKSLNNVSRLKIFGRHISNGSYVDHCIKICDILDYLPVVEEYAPRDKALSYVIDNKLFINFLHKAYPTLLFDLSVALNEAEDRLNSFQRGI